MFRLFTLPTVLKNWLCPCYIAISVAWNITAITNGKVVCLSPGQSCMYDCKYIALWPTASWMYGYWCHKFYWWTLAVTKILSVMLAPIISTYWNSAVLTRVVHLWISMRRQLITIGPTLESCSIYLQMNVT